MAYRRKLQMLLRFPNIIYLVLICVYVSLNSIQQSMQITQTNYVFDIVRKNKIQTKDYSKDNLDQCMPNGDPVFFEEVEPYHHTGNLLNEGPFKFLHDYKNPCFKQKLGLNEERLRCLPYFFIIGFPKCGTTDLWDRMTLHPDIVARHEKESHFLDDKRFTINHPWTFQTYLNYLDATSEQISKYVRSRIRLPGVIEPYHHLISGWKKCGSIEVAQTKDRLTQIKRKAALAKAVGEECELLLPKDIKEKCGWIRYTDLQGALWYPNDGAVTAPDLVQTFARKAREKGVKILEGVGVKTVLTEDDKVSSVETTHGDIKCDYFVNCTGMWARELGKRSMPKVRIPVHPCEHFYIVTQPIKDMDPKLPVIRDPDGHVYFREWNGGIMAGGFEPPSQGGKPVFHTGIPEKFEFQLLPEDWDHFQVLLDGILNRMPVLETAQVRQLTNGPESFTPDTNWILGQSAEVTNYYVAAGMHSRGIQAAGGVGKFISELMVDGYASLANLWRCDIKRFVPHHSNRKFLKERVKETIACYHLTYPNHQFSSGRNLRTSPIHTQLEVAGAFFGETNAYERAMFFDPVHDDEYVDHSQMTKGTYGKPGWFGAVKEEYKACKERVCLVDMSSFTKIEIKSKGPEALNFLQYMCCNNIDQEQGTIIHTGMLNAQGGYENDCSIVPLRDSYFMIAPTTQQTRSLFWLHTHLPKDGSVQVRDVTSMYSGLNLIGPHAQQLLSDVTETSTSKSDFKPMTCQVIDVGNASNIVTMRLTHSGEDGFILYIPSEYALHVYETLMRAGKDYGIHNAGYYCIRHLRIEKLFAYWGLDMGPTTTPFESGREFRVNLQKGNFIGRDALIKQKQEGVSKKFCQFLLEDFDVDKDIWPQGGEPIYRNNEFVGLTTSSAYGFTLGCFVCLGFIHHKDEHGKPLISKKINDYILDRNALYEIDVAGKRYATRVGIYTPKMAYKSSDRPTFIPVPSGK